MKFESKKIKSIILVAIVMAIIVYGVSYLLSTRELFLDYKNILLCVFFAFIYACIFVQYKKVIFSFCILSSLYFVLGISIPFINYLDQPLYISRLIKDVLFYLTLPLPLLFLSVFLGKLFGSKYVLVCTVLTGVFMLPIILVVGYYFLFDAKLSVDTVVAIMQTDLQESKEFIYTYISVMDILILTIGYLSVLFATYIFFRNILYGINIQVDMGRRYRLVSICLFIVLITNSSMLFSKTYMVRTVQRGLALYNNLVLFDENKEVRETKLREDCVVGDSDNGNFALVIGETHNRSHMSVFGYNRKTTPWLETAVSSDKVILPINIYSCAAQTQQALELALTEKSQYNNIKLKNAMTIVEMARHAGFKIVWVTNHVNNTIAGLIAGDADEIYWLNNSKNDTYNRQKTKYIDSLVVNTIKEFKKSHTKTLYVMHLIGSHAAYRFKYPENFNIWDDEDEINAYDNSILFNDYIMSELYKHLFNELDVDGLFYFADHGEELKKYFCHGTDFFLKNYRELDAAIDIIKIPVYFAFSHKYQERRPDVIAGLASNRNKFFTNDMVYDTMLGIMNIKCCHYDSKQDFTSSDYKFSLNDLKTISGRLKLSDCINEKR